MLKPYLIPCLVLVAGCAEAPALQIPRGFDPQKVSTLYFRIEDSEQSQLHSMTPAQIQELGHGISSRFVEAGYPVFDAQVPQSPMGDRNASDAPGSKHAYRLIAAVSKPELTETPSGFSLDFGNADPRAPGYQKTLTINIRCRLAGRDHELKEIALNERVMIPKSVAELSAYASDDFAKLRDYYLENIGATCHDLLSELHIYPEQAEIEQSSKSFGSIRIQSEYESDANTAPAPSTEAPAAARKETEYPPSTSPEAPASFHEAETTTSRPPLPRTEKLLLKPLKPSSPSASSTQSSVPGLGSDTRPARLEPSPLSAKKTVKEALPDQHPPLPVAMERNSEVQNTQPEETESDPTLRFKKNETRDWRKKKITIFNRGDTVILKFGPEQSRY